MKIRSKLLYLIIIFLVFCFSALESYGQGFYLRIYSGYDFEGDSRWKDVDCEDDTYTPLYGCGYYADGKSGNTLIFDAFIGYHINSSLAIELGMLNRPRIKYKGQVNYPDSGEDQPIRADINSMAFLLNANIDILDVFGYYSYLFNPYFGIGMGISINKVDSIEMYFPELTVPHIFITPGGRETSFCYTVSIGNSIQLSETIKFDINAHYTSFGDMITEPGDGMLVRGDETIMIPINDTKSKLQTFGIRIGLKYNF